MKPLEFLMWIRDEMFCCPQSTEGNAVGLPSNGELRRWIDKGVVKVNNKILSKGYVVEFPVHNFVFFPKNEQKRVTII